MDDDFSPHWCQSKSVRQKSRKTCEVRFGPRNSNHGTLRDSIFCVFALKVEEEGSSFQTRSYELN